MEEKIRKEIEAICNKHGVNIIDTLESIIQQIENEDD
jgi:regulator of PEP synthase PpsR (kinase-PPPase family)